jgi:hypothetical protein
VGALELNEYAAVAAAHWAREYLWPDAGGSAAHAIATPSPPLVQGRMAATTASKNSLPDSCGGSKGCTVIASAACAPVASITMRHTTAKSATAWASEHLHRNGDAGYWPPASCPDSTASAAAARPTASQGTESLDELGGAGSIAASAQAWANEHVLSLGQGCAAALLPGPCRRGGSGVGQQAQTLPASAMGPSGMSASAQAWAREHLFADHSSSFTLAV